MNATSSIRCTDCDNGALQLARLRITLLYDGQSFTVDENQGLRCDACGDELIGERTTAFLLTHRALAPHVEMSVTVSRATEIV
jgi:hypothetical protein